MRERDRDSKERDIVRERHGYRESERDNDMTIECERETVKRQSWI